jgi:cardiolipin synthase
MRLTINLPNILTVIRILLVPLFVFFLLKKLFAFALLVFTLAGISDGLDGLLAKYYNQRTTLGTYLDPIADKLLLSAAFISLAILKIVPGWLTVIVITRDVLIVLGIAVFSITDIKFEIKPSLVSKCTTVLQLSAIIFTLLDLKISGTLMMKDFLYWFTAGFTITSGLHYIYIGLNILQSASGNSQTQR